jgi:hypothetical protein
VVETDFPNTARTEENRMLRSQPGCAIGFGTGSDIFSLLIRRLDREFWVSRHDLRATACIRIRVNCRSAQLFPCGARFEEPTLQMSHGTEKPPRDLGIALGGSVTVIGFSLHMSPQAQR